MMRWFLKWFLKCFLKCFLNFFLVQHYLPCSRSAMRKIKHLPRVQPPAKFVHEFGPLVSTTFGVDEDNQGLQKWGGNGLDNKWTILFLGFFPFYRGPPLFSQRWFERPLKKINHVLQFIWFNKKKFENISTFPEYISIFN